MYPMARLLPPQQVCLCMFTYGEWSAVRTGPDGKKTTWGRPKLSALLALLGVAALSGGCAAVAPATSILTSANPSALEIHNNTEVRLQEKNFIVVRANVVGQSKGFSLLGVLTIVPATFTKAMSRLYAQAEMPPGSSRTLSNLVMEKDNSFFILFSIPRTTIRADVIEFTPATSTGIERQPPPGNTKSKAGTGN
jgi:hypothetical protein